MVDSADHSIGILIDLDLAVQIRDGDQMLDTPAARIGTLPFLSIDLLEDTLPPKHLYRHDLEAFYYVLAWICIQYDHGRPKKTDVLVPWYTGGLSSIRRSKTGFLGEVRSGWIPKHTWLRSSWLISLGDLFQKAHYALRHPDHHPGVTLDPETAGGQITFETFMSCIQS